MWLKDDSIVFGDETASLGNQSRVQSSRNCRLLQMKAVYVPDTFVRNVGNWLPNDEAPYLGRLESSTTLKWKLKNLPTQRRYVSCSSAFLSHKACIVLNSAWWNDINSVLPCATAVSHKYTSGWLRSNHVAVSPRETGWLTNVVCIARIAVDSVSSHNV